MGSRLLYFIVILPLSICPFWILYRVSDFLYLVLYHVLGYRKKVVERNLLNSFPDKTFKERKQIESRFYSHLCDLVVESLKAFTISDIEASKRMKHLNVEVLNEFQEQGKSVVLVGGHYGNWELYAVTVAQQIKHNAVALFTPLKSKFFNDKIKRSRSKFGLQLMSIHDIKERMANLAKEPNAVIFGADQSPRKSQKAYWMEFLNQETGVQFGTERFAKEYDLPVVFGQIYKIKRGYYEVRYSLITRSPTETLYGEITESHTKMLEKEILNKPEFWLWSHKRWKHKRPDFQE